MTQNLESIIGYLRDRFGKERVDEQLAALELHGDVIDDPALWLEEAVKLSFKFMPIEKVSRCTCGSNNTTYLANFVFWNLLGVRSCHDCGVVFVSPRLTAESMKKVFNETYFDYSDPDYWGSRRKPVFDDVLKLLDRYGGKEVFDVGAAFGHFCHAAKQRGFVVSGCDISEQAVEWGKENLGIPLVAGTLLNLDLPQSSVDTVVSLDTLYYSSDPMTELKKMRSMLKPNGVAVIRLRNGLFTSVKIKRESKKRVGSAVMPTEHIWSFPPKTIETLFKRSGFETLTIEPAASSKTILAPIQSGGLLFSKVLTKVGLPIITRSFNVVARKVG